MRPTRSFISILSLACALLFAVTLGSGCQRAMHKRTRPASGGQWQVLRTLDLSQIQSGISLGAPQFALDPDGRYIWILEPGRRRILHTDLAGSADRVLDVTQREEIKSKLASVVALGMSELGRLCIVIVDRDYGSIALQRGGPHIAYRVIKYDDNLQPVASTNFMIPSTQSQVINSIASAGDDTLYVLSSANTGDADTQVLSCFDEAGKVKWSMSGSSGTPIPYALSPLVLHNDTPEMQGFKEHFGRVVAISSIEGKDKATPLASVNGFDLLGIDERGNIFVSDYDTSKGPESLVVPSILEYAPTGELVSTTPLPVALYPRDLTSSVLISAAGDYFLVALDFEGKLNIYTYR